MKLTQQEQTLHRQFSEYGRNAREWTRKCALLLPEIDRRQIWRKRGCGSLYEYAAKVAGMSRAGVDEALWVLRKTENEPELRKVIAEKGLRSVRPVLSIVTPETASFWAQKAQEMPIHALETYVRNYREDLIHVNKIEPEKIVLKLELSTELAKRLGALSKTQGFEALLQKALDILEESKGELPAAVKTSSRHIPKPIKDYVEERTTGLCSYPTCKKQATSLHHTQRFALEKVHDPNRLRGVCTDHERLAHLGLIDNEEADPRTWKLRTEPDKTHPKFFVDSMVALYR